MNMKNIVSLNFSDRIRRLDYFKGGLASVLIALSAVALFGVGGNIAESNEVLGMIVLLVGIAPLGYAVILQVALVARRFRDIGFSDNGALFALVIGYFVANAFIPFVSLVLLFWKGKELEAVAA